MLGLLQENRFDIDELDKYALYARKKTDLTWRLYEKWKIWNWSFFFSPYFFHHTVQNMTVQSLEINTKQNMRDQKFLSGIQGRNFSKKQSYLKWIEFSPPAPYCYHVCLPSFLFAVCLLAFACLAFYVSTDLAPWMMFAEKKNMPLLSASSSTPCVETSFLLLLTIEILQPSFPSFLRDFSNPSSVLSSELSLIANSICLFLTFWNLKIRRHILIYKGGDVF